MFRKEPGIGPEKFRKYVAEYKEDLEQTGEFEDDGAYFFGDPNPQVFKEKLAQMAEEERVEFLRREEGRISGLLLNDLNLYHLWNTPLDDFTPQEVDEFKDFFGADPWTVYGVDIDYAERGLKELKHRQLEQIAQEKAAEINVPNQYNEEERDAAFLAKYLLQKCGWKDPLPLENILYFSQFYNTAREVLEGYRGGKNE